jgi:serine/threonine protein kinase/cold shock CspA family protein
MGRRADSDHSRVFVYVSEGKLADQLKHVEDQTRPNILERLRPTVTLSGGVVSASVTPQPADQSIRNLSYPVQVAAAEKQIRQRGDVGDLAVGDEWIAGRADLSKTLIENGETVLFSGYAGPLLIALRGSEGHRIGRRRGSYPIARRNVVLDEDPMGDLGPVLAAAVAAAGSEPRPLRFLAEVIRRGTLAGDGPQREFVYATPLYVEKAHRADEPAAAPVQGTVSWFSADKGWGLVTPDDGRDAVVVPAAAVPGGDGWELTEGQRVEFRVTHGTAGIQAAAVRVLTSPAGATGARLVALSRGRPLGPGDPTRIDQYTLLWRLGEGAMGVVYLARVDGADDRVAIKLIRPEYAGDPVFLSRFQAEADHASRVHALNVAQVIAAVTNTNQPYLVTEFVDGPTLEERVAERGRLPEHSAVQVAQGIAEALAAIHAADLIHRDLAPSNVILAESGPKVIDFGLARAIGADTQHTQPGLLVGTPAYMSPEQVAKAELTRASDVFSWAGLTVFAATGHQPFATAETSPIALLWQIGKGRPNLKGLPRQLRATVKDAMDKVPAKRPTAAQLLRRPPFGSPARRLPRPSVFLVVGGGATAVVAVVAVLLAALLSSPSSSGSAPGTGSTVTEIPPSAHHPPAAVSGTRIGTLSDPSGYGVTDVVFSPDGKTIVGSFTGGSDTSVGDVDSWDSGTQETLYRLTDLRPWGATSVAFSPANSNNVAMGGGDGVILWNLATGSSREYSDPDPYGIADVAYTPDGKSIVAADYSGDVFRRSVTDENVPSGGWSRIFQDPVTNDSYHSSTSTPLFVYQVAVSSTGQHIVLTDESGNAYIWNPSGGPPIVLHDVAASIDAVAFSPDGKTLAIAERGMCQLLDLATRTISGSFTEAGGSPTAVAFSPNGASLAVADYNGDIYLRNVATGQQKTIATGVPQLIGLAFSPDGRTLVAYDYLDPKAYLYRVYYAEP